MTLGWARHGCKRDVCDLHLIPSLSQCQSLRVFQIYNDASHEAETPQWTPPILCSSCIHSWCNIVLLRTQTNHVACCEKVLGLKQNSLRFSKNPIDFLYRTVIGLIMPTMEARFAHPACFAFCRISKVSRKVPMLRGPSSVQPVLRLKASKDWEFRESARGLRSGGEQCCCSVVCCYLTSSKKAPALTLTFIKSLLHKGEQVQHFFSLLQLTQLRFLLNVFFGQKITPCQPLNTNLPIKVTVCIKEHFR